MSLDDEIYRQKYLKYKAKYLELKEQEGGVYFGTGNIIFFYDTRTYIVPDTLYLETSLNEFTDKIGNTAYYYRLSDKNVDNDEHFLIYQNRSNTEIASSIVEATARKAKRAAGKAAAAVKAAAARAACALLDKNWHMCEIKEVTEEEAINTYKIPVNKDFKEINATDRDGFIKRSKKIIELLPSKNEHFGAVLLNVGSLRSQITQKYTPYENKKLLK